MGEGVGRVRAQGCREVVWALDNSPIDKRLVTGREGQAGPGEQVGVGRLRVAGCSEEVWSLDVFPHEKRLVIGREG